MTKKIKLSQGQIALVDGEDYEWLSKFKWVAYKALNRNKTLRTYYAFRIYHSPYVNGQRYFKTIYMHREILKALPGQLVDHSNRNGLDNRRKNIRLCDHFENRYNSKKPHNSFQSKFKGVYPYKNGNWRSGIQHRGKYIHFGTFKTELKAAIIYNTKVKQFRGSFAYLNFQ